MQVKILVRLSHHMLTPQRRTILDKVLCDLAADDPEADMTSQAILFVGDNDESIPIFVSIIRSPYDQETKLVMANDCKSWEDAKELQTTMTMAVEEHFGEEAVKTKTTTWTNPTLN